MTGTAPEAAISTWPVAVPAGMKPVLASEKRLKIGPGHPLADSPCPACGRGLGSHPVSAWAPDEPPAVVLVFAGIPPSSRGNDVRAEGAAVAVHEMCAGVSDSG